MSTLTVAYVTSRLRPRIEWFFDSLALRIKETPNLPTIRVVVVDYHHAKRAKDEFFKLVPKSVDEFFHVPPKPCVWQGPYKLTQEDYFAAANTRNTALCLAPDGYIAYVDDLSILMPGWLSRVNMAIFGNYVALGAYKKLKNMVVEGGKLISATDHPPGVDSRWKHGNHSMAVPASGSWMYGCSVAMPVSALLECNGWMELGDTTGMGGEDYLTGMLIERNGYQFRYDLSMLTLESEEAHHEEPPLKRVIERGYHPDDSSVALLNIVKNSDIRMHPGYANMREMRAEVLSGKPFPIVQIPEHNWYSGKPLKEY